MWMIRGKNVLTLPQF